jgi:tRNA modification GTPase
VAVLDAAAAGEPADDAALLAELVARAAALVVAVNKSDAADPAASVERAREMAPGAEVVVTSATRGEGIRGLVDAIVRAATDRPGAGTGAVSSGDDAVLVTSARHADALRRAADALETARETLAQGLPVELVAVDAHGALQALGEITGETVREDVIAGIFARFCIGK